MCFAPQRGATFINFSSLFWPDRSAPAALVSLLFDPPEPQIHGKTQWIATFLPFRAPASSFPWLFLTSAFPSVHILGSLTSKLSPNLRLILLIIANKHSKPPEINIDQHRNNDICNNVHLSFPVWLNPIEGHPLALSLIYPLVDVGDKSIRTLSKIESTLT